MWAQQSNLTQRLLSHVKGATCKRMVTIGQRAPTEVTERRALWRVLLGLD